MTSTTTLISTLAVILVLTGTVRLNAQNAVAGELHVTQSANGNAVVLRPAGSTVQQNITLPTALPSAVGQVLSVQSISGNNVTLQWANPVCSGAATEIRVVATDQNQGNTFVNANNMSIPVAANKVYEFNALIRIQRPSGTPNMQIDFENIPTGATMLYYYIWVSDGAANDDGNFNAATDVTLNGQAGTSVYELRGIVIMGGNSGNLQMRFRSSDASHNIRLVAGSLMRLTTNN